LTTAAGAVQIISIMVLFCLSMTPSRPHTEGRLWIMRARAMLFFSLQFLGLIALPFFALLWALTYRDSTQVLYLWNVACFFNSMFLTAVIMKAKAKKMLQHLLKPAYPQTSSSVALPSFAIVECPTRQLYLREDIYCFCWTLCKSKTEMRRLGFKE
jgi:hypothetical protein